MTGSQRKLNIIVLDDDPSISSSFQKLLEHYGHSVRTYPDPTACPIYEKHQGKCVMDSPCVDVLISDVNMPHVSGIELYTEQIKCGCKILTQNRALMSSGMTVEQEATVAALGCEFFRKPFNTHEVLQWLDQCASRTMAYNLKSEKVSP